MNRFNPIAASGAIHNGASTDGATIYVTGLPVCHQCADAIIQTGIKRVVMDTLPILNWEASGNLAIQKFQEAGVEFKFVEEINNDIRSNEICFSKWKEKIW